LKSQFRNYRRHTDYQSGGFGLYTEREGAAFCVVLPLLGLLKYFSDGVDAKVSEIRAAGLKVIENWKEGNANVPFGAKRKPFGWWQKICDHSWTDAKGQVKE